MADFVAVIRRAVDGLSENSPEHRERVYQKARNAVRRQLESMSPRPSDDVVAKQLDKLEAAIGEVELEHTEALPALDEGVVAAPEESVEPTTREPAEEPAVAAGAGAVEASPSELSDQDESYERRYDFDDEPRDYELEQTGEGPVVEGGAAREATGAAPRELEADVPPSPFGDEPLIGDAHDEAFGLGQAEWAGRRRRKRSRSRGLVIALIAVIVLVAAAYGLWSNRTSVAPMIASLSSSSPDNDTSASSPANKPAPSNEAAVPPAGEQAAKPDTGGDQQANAPDDLPKGGKYTQRLMADGSETNPGPAAEPGQTQPAEGHSVSAQTANAEPDAGATPNQATGAGTAAQDQAGQQPAAISQKMYLYEERFNDQAPSATTGSVVWSLAKESPGGDAPPEPAIHGEISVPDKGITALITIKRNADKSLPASHLIEIVFALPGDFDGGGIDSVQRVSLKQTEQARGDPLIAVPAKITDNFFMVALNDYPQAVKSNLDLLKTRNWIDIPITYTNGRRALITLEKGSSGTEVFDKALAAWTAEASKAADSGAPAAGEATTGGNPPAPNPTGAGGTGTPPVPKPGQ